MLTPLAAGSAATVAVAWVAGERWLALGVVVAWWLAWRDRARPQIPASAGPRLFSEADRAVLFIRARGRCQMCAAPIHWQRTCPGGGCDLCFHADHRTAWADGGPTHLANGQALCRACNLAKSDL